MGQELAALESLKVETRPILADISVVIPTLGRDILESCLYWIAVGAAWPTELIVVDQGNRLQVKEWLQVLSDAGMRTCYVPSQRRGRAAGINSGLREVKTRFVAITDDDCFIDQEWLLKMVTCLRCSPERIFTGRVEPAGMLDVNFCTVTSRTPITYIRPQLTVHPLIGGNIGVAMERVRQIGFFDEHPSISPPKIAIGAIEPSRKVFGFHMILTYYSIIIIGETHPNEPTATEIIHVVRELSMANTC